MLFLPFTYVLPITYQKWSSGIGLPRTGVSKDPDEGSEGNKPTAYQTRPEPLGSIYRLYTNINLGSIRPLRYKKLETSLHELRADAEPVYRVGCLVYTLFRRYIRFFDGEFRRQPNQRCRAAVRHPACSVRSLGRGGVTFPNLRSSTRLLTRFQKL